jgi:hypothetical protein
MASGARIPVTRTSATLEDVAEGKGPIIIGVIPMLR